jgi:hypothetical protein
MNFNCRSNNFLSITIVGGDVDIVAGITKLGEQVAGNTKLEQQYKRPKE